MIEDSELYFKESWQNHWNVIGMNSKYFISSYNGLIHQTLKKYDIGIDQE